MENTLIFIDRHSEPSDFIITGVIVIVFVAALYFIRHSK